MAEPKVLIACPTFDGKSYCLDRWIEAVKKIDYPNFDILLVDNSEGEGYAKRIEQLDVPVLRSKRHERARDTIAESRNVIRKKVIDEGYDYLFSLEQDVIPLPDTLQKLLSHKLPIIGGVYCHLKTDNFGKTEAKPLVYQAVSKEEFELLKSGDKFKGSEIQEKIKKGIIKGPEDVHSQLSLEHVKEPQLMEVLFTGLGCLLISKEVLKKVTFRPGEESFDDATFAEDARKAGYKIIVDTGVTCAHIQYDTSWQGIDY